MGIVFHLQFIGFQPLQDTTAVGKAMLYVRILLGEYGDGGQSNLIQSNPIHSRIYDTE